MSRGINKVILVGNIGEEPVVSTTHAGLNITKISLATNESWVDKAGNKQDRAEWHRITMFGKLAEIAAKYATKGRQIYIEGSLRTSKYQKDGIDRFSTEIIASEMQLLGSSPGFAGNDAPQQRQQAHAQQQQAPENETFPPDYPFN